MRYPSPLEALICSANTRSNHATAMARRKPTRKPGSAPGNTMRRIAAPPAQADHLGQLAVAGIDGADGGVGVDIDREHHAERDHGDLRRLPDAEPQDEERLEPDDRARTGASGRCRRSGSRRRGSGQRRMPGAAPMGTPKARPQTTRWSDAHSAVSSEPLAQRWAPDETTALGGASSAELMTAEQGGGFPDADEQDHADQSSSAGGPGQEASTG